MKAAVHVANASSLAVRDIPSIPTSFSDGIAVVEALDKIRGAYDDFGWFAREIPRNFRYHLDHVDYRLDQIHAAYTDCRSRLPSLLKDSPYGVAVWDVDTLRLHWEFEAYLNAMSSALDTLARICGLFFEGQVPSSFKGLAKKSDLGPPADLLKAASDRWVMRMKDYRDCFVHWTPIDNRPFVFLIQSGGEWRVACRLPTNPNVRDTDSFRYSRRLDLLDYSITTRRHMQALDRKIARHISRAYRDGDFPKRTSGFFGVGERQRKRK